MTSQKRPGPAMHDSIERGLLRVVRTCKRCGGVYEANITYQGKPQCIACDVADEERALHEAAEQAGVAKGDT